MRSIFCLALVLLLNGWTLGADAERPNILWITSEDNGCELGCYGDGFATTPNLDRFAARAMRFENAWSNAPVCAPARTAIITGVWPPSLGASHMRSEVNLPPHIDLFPTLLRRAGYYCSNNVKEDYNVSKHTTVWDDSSKTAHWRNRKPNQPFFAVFNSTSSHESQLRTRPHKAVHRPEQVDVPKYHPDLPEIRQDWAQYYDKLTEMDTQLGQVLQQLDDDGLTDSTIVFYFGDHGSGMPRGKRWLYQSGLRVPLMVSVPPRFLHLTNGRYIPGGNSFRLTSFLDLAPTVLGLCGIEAPEYFDGNSIFAAKTLVSADVITGFRDRMDERYDCSRAVRDEQFLYIKNFMPHRPQGQYLEYMYQTPSTIAWLNKSRQGKVTPAQHLFWSLKPSEELYDLKQDPQQLHNLAKDPNLRSELERFRSVVLMSLINQRDLGLVPEPTVQELVHRSDAPDASPWSVANSGAINFQGVAAAAMVATSLETELSNVETLASSQDPIVRYWATIGLVNRSLRKKPMSTDLLRKLAASDDSDVVRCVANEGIARLFDGPDRAEAINRLWEIASKTDQSIFLQMQAMDSMLAANLRAAELPKDLEKLANKNPGVAARYETYPQRLVESLQRLAVSPELHLPIEW